METLDGAEGEACVDESDGFFKGFGDGESNETHVGA
jgi:hypothetical protein